MDIERRQKTEAIMHSIFPGSHNLKIGHNLFGYKLFANGRLDHNSCHPGRDYDNNLYYIARKNSDIAYPEKLTARLTEVANLMGKTLNTTANNGDIIYFTFPES